VLLLNSVFAVVSVILFFISSWSFFLASGAITIPLLIGTALLYKYTPLRGPIKRYIINTCVNIYNGFVQRREGLLRRIYLAICWFLPTEEWKHINWGYASLHKKGHSIKDLNPADEDKRTYYQLYHYLATGLGNWNTLEGKNVLELRSGGGGGINYVAQKLNPDKCMGVDISSTQSNFCKKAYSKIPKLSFYTADTLDSASQIPELVDQRVDMIISAQSSKYVKDFKQFIHEIETLLKPGGVFAFADLKLVEDWAQIESNLTSTSLKIIQREDISQNVMKALEIDEKGKWQVLNRYIGSVARMIFKVLGIVRNNIISEALKKKTDSARCYLLLKPSTH